MCRARPGPRCSYSAGVRHSRAKKNSAKVQSKIDKFVQSHPGDALPEKLAMQLHDAHLRAEQANKVWYATPKGQEELARSIVGIEKNLDSMLNSQKTLDSSTKKKVARAQRALQVKNRLLEEGIKRRMNSYSDLHDFHDERPILRQESINRGADLTPRAQKNTSSKDYTTGKPEKVELQPFTPEQLERAYSWVESGSDTGWEKGGRFIPPKKIGDVKIGTKADEPMSRLMRLSTPDGTVVESRHDMHITKNDEGKFVVSRRTTTAASFEDASPIDQNTQELGHLLKNTHGIDRVEILGTYNSLQAARTRRGMIANNSSNLPDRERVDFAAEAAKSGRDLTISRFGNKNNKDTMNRGFVVARHRYERTLQEDDSRNTFYKQDIKKQRKRDKMMEKARESMQ